LSVEAKNLVKLDLRNNQISSLDLSGCEKLVEVDCYNNRLTDLILPKIKEMHPNLQVLRCAGNRLTGLNLTGLNKLTKLDCSTNQLISIGLHDLSSLRVLDCCNNFLTETKFINRLPQPQKLEELRISDNNFSLQDLKFLLLLPNLKHLFLGSIDQERISKNICNRFFGSLSYLNGIKGLKKLIISNTDINEVDLNKLPSSLEFIDYSIKERPESKLIQIIPELEEYE
jgi:hypothetical protein